MAAKAGLRGVNVLADQPVDAGSAGAVFGDLLASGQLDGVLLYQGRCYVAPSGSVSAVHGRPVVGARFALWPPQGMGPDEVAQAVLRMPRDPASAAGYSLVPVHVWSHTVADVVRTVTAIANDLHGLQVVTPTELLRRVRAHVVA